MERISLGSELQMRYVILFEVTVAESGDLTGSVLLVG